MYNNKKYRSLVVFISYITYHNLALTDDYSILDFIQNDCKAFLDGTLKCKNCKHSILVKFKTIDYILPMCIYGFSTTSCFASVLDSIYCRNGMNTPFNRNRKYITKLLQGGN